MSEQKDMKVILYTTTGKEIPRFNSRVEVVVVPTSASGLFRWILTLVFYFLVFLRLLSTRSMPVLYYESLSSIPVWFYLSFFRRSNRKFAAHFHEYFSNIEYKGHSFWERTGRKVESSVFNKFSWISHTNSDRINFFQQEFPTVLPETLHALPNYPPKSWLVTNSWNTNTIPIKLVYVGSLSFEGTYLKEIVQWVLSQKGELTCDFFSLNANASVIAFLNSLDQNVISFKGSVSYEDLPGVLSNYHVGLVLYKSGSMNTNYCAPNKIFEYLACGLDVWFSHILMSSHPYQQKETYPKVIMVDFTQLNDFDYRNAVNRNGFVNKLSPYTMESVYNTFYKKIFQF